MSTDLTFITNENEKRLKDKNAQSFKSTGNTSNPYTGTASGIPLCGV
jgi:hypothetical protein